MRNFTRYYRRMKLAGLGTIFLSLLCMFLFVPAMERPVIDENNYFKIYLNNTFVGAVHEEAQVRELMTAARAMLARESSELVLLEPDLNVQGSSVYFGRTDSRDYIINYMYGVLSEGILRTRERAYTVKVNEFTVNLRTADEVVTLLNAAKDKYDPDGEYVVELVLDDKRELNVLTTQIVKKEEQAEEDGLMPLAGCDSVLEQLLDEAFTEHGQFDLGLKSLDFGDSVEVVEAYLSEDEVTSLADAVELLTRDLEKSTVYEVQSGDVLSTIAEKTNVPMEKIIALNDHLENENSVIRAGEELIVTIPEPELSVVRQEEIYTEENYNAPIEYVDNDSWYTNKQETLQDPVEGFRKAVSLVTYRNENVAEREIVWEEVTMEAVPKIVERGTKVPPTYVKPISGGRQSSGFGARWGRTHKGIDWACPIGTEVRASSAGTVARAGWGSGYGYVVYINHADGRQTRYGHLSKVLVSAGQSVKQGDRIALSGNTGRSTGPHVHFEILINGSQVNPLQYIN